MSSESNKNERYAYLDLLATALAEHEKNLNDLIERLAVIVKKFTGIIDAKSEKQNILLAEDSDSLEGLLDKAKGVLSD